MREIGGGAMVLRSKEAVEQIQFEGLSISLLPTVYSPSDDSFLLAKRAAKLARGAVLEVGCGSGIVSLACAKNNPNGFVLGVDVNPKAVLCAKKNAKENGIGNVKFIKSDLFSGIGSGKFDWILFNPPYLPTANWEKLVNMLENAAYDGGRDGGEVIGKFLSGFQGKLLPSGKLLLLSSSLSGTKKTVLALERKGFRVKTLEKQSFFFEQLEVLLATRGSLG